jgi:hypothetical protein
VPAKAAAETFDFRNFLGAIAPTSLWRVNFKRFNTAFQKEACSQFLADKYEDPAVSKIVAVMFNDNLPLPSSEGSDLHTYPMSGAAIARAVLESTAGDPQFGQLMSEAITGCMVRRFLSAAEVSGRFGRVFAGSHSDCHPRAGRGLPGGLSLQTQYGLHLSVAKF